MELNPTFGKTTIADTEFSSVLIQARKAKEDLQWREYQIWTEIRRIHNLSPTHNLRARGLYLTHPGRKDVRVLEDQFAAARDKAIDAARLVIPRSMYPSGQSGTSAYRRALAKYVDMKLSA